MATLIAGAFGLQRVAHSGEEARVIPPPAQDEAAQSMHRDDAVLVAVASNERAVSGVA